MKKIITLTVFTVLIFPPTIFCQLNGFIFLSGQSNHSGIKAKFISQGGTAITDSTFTGTNGSFSINIAGGMYKVVFSKTGYLDYNYNGGTNILLTNTVTLNSVTLTPGIQVNVSGNVNGNWSSNNVYIVMGHLTIPSGQTLSIQAGTTIKFNGNYSVTANGALQANGTALNPIYFTSNMTVPTPNDWDRIVLMGNGSKIDHCIFEYCNAALQILNCSPPVTNNEFRNFRAWAIDANNSSSLISKNWIHDFKTEDIAEGISYNGSSTSIVVECNTIHDGNGYGIRPGGSGVVKNNIIYNIKGFSRGYAFGCGYGTWAQITNNFINNCNGGFWIYESFTPNTCHAYIYNNTITNMANNGILMQGFVNADIINNIITNNNVGINASSTPSIVSNNLVWNNTNSNYSGAMAGFGVTVTTNSQGNPIDSYYNLSQDPLFVNNVPPALSVISPCYNAGKSDISLNIGFDTAYTCVGGIQSIKNQPKETSTLRIFPNPSNGEFTLETINKNEKGELIILNSLGQIIHLQEVKTGINTIHLKGATKGLYHIKYLQTGGLTYFSKILIE